MEMIRVLIADDHFVVREGARLVVDQEPDMEVCAMTESAAAIPTLVAAHKPNVVVLDMQMPGTDAVTTVTQLKKSSPTLEIVIFTASTADGEVTRLFEAGVRSFIRKGESGSLLTTAIRAAADHKPFFTPPVSEILFSRLMKKSSTGDGNHAPHLTPREQEIVRLVASGRSNKEAANTLGISTRTVETHRASIMRKLGITSSADLVRYAIRTALVEP